nr:hypothetical protein [Orientia tsutsugamushi]
MLDEPKSNNSTYELTNAAEHGITSAAAKIISKIGTLYGIQPYHTEMTSVQNLKNNNNSQHGIK